MNCCSNSKPKKYVLVPGWVQSKTDDQEHYIGIGQLARFYRLRTGEYLPYDKFFHDRHRISRLSYTPIFLGPRYNGDYSHACAKMFELTQQENMTDDIRKQQPLMRSTACGDLVSIDGCFYVFKAIGVARVPSLDLEVGG
jgi:hypothetical protein